MKLIDKLKSAQIAYIKLTYKFVCKIYQIIADIYEEILLRRELPNSTFKVNGTFDLVIDNNLNLENLLKSEIFEVNEYLDVHKLSNKNIKALLKNFLTNVLDKKSQA